MNSRSALAAAFVGLLALVGSRPAEAGGPHVGPTHTVILQPLESEGLIEADHAKLDATIRPAFEHPDIAVITAEEMSACADQSCMRALGRELEATHIVHVVLVADGRDYVARFEVLTVESDAPPASIDASCLICGLAELDDRLAARAVAARELILATPQIGRLRIHGRPNGARVRIDGRWLGKLPYYTSDLGVGGHELVITASGYFRRVIPIETVAGVEELIEIELEPKPIPRWRRPVGWTAIVVAGASLATGSALIGIDGRPVPSRCNSGEPGVIDSDGDCRWLRRTQGAGIGLTLAGIATATAGITLLAIDSRQRRARMLDRDPQVRVGVGIGRLDLQVRF